MKKYVEHYQHAIINTASQFSIDFSMMTSADVMKFDSYTDEMIVEIQFVGEVNGSFLIVAKEDIFKQISLPVLESDNEKFYKSFWLDFINIVIQDPLDELAKEYRYLTINAPRIYHAPVDFPEYDCSTSSVLWKGNALGLHFLFNPRRIKTMEAFLEEEYANKSKSLFLANMSHDIRTPLNAVIGFSEMLEQRDIDSASMSFVKKIRQSSLSLLDLINDLMDLTKVEAGKIDLKPRPVSIKDLLYGVVQMTSLQAEEKGLKLILDVCSSIPKYLKLDEARLRQVLINFTVNAIKFTNEGEIKLSAGWQTNHDNSRIGTLELSVKDDGIGIPENMQSQVFSAYEQVNKDKYSGSGLGLAISQRLIQLMGGEIKLESSQGVGSKFTAVIPDVRKSKSPADLTRNLRFNLDCEFSQAKILIIDDNNMNRTVFRAFLKDFPFEVVEAASGKEGLDLMKSDKPDLIILDWRMPGMNGFDVIKNLQNDKNLRSIPVIVVTASALKEDRDLILSICGGFLSKPVIKQDLIDELKKHLSCKAEKTENVLKQETDNSDLINCCSKVIEPILKRFKENLSSVNFMLELTNSLQDISSLYPVPVFEDWHKAVYSACDMFDVKKLEVLIDQYDQMISSL